METFVVKLTTQALTLEITGDRLITGEHSYLIMETQPTEKPDITRAAFPRDVVAYIARQDAIKVPDA